jgi:hypothetical protein
MKNSFYVFILTLFLSLFLISCSNSYNSTDINYRVGTKGVELEFIQNSPPQVVYEGSSFPISVLVSNEGAYSLTGSPEDNKGPFGTLSFSYDSFYLSIDSDMSADEEYIVLAGRSYLYPEGDIITKYLPVFKANQMVGQRENPYTDIFVSACYPYNTKLLQEVCIDSASVFNDERTQVCNSQDIFLESQGGPLAITKIGVDMQPFGRIVRPSFLIQIENKGSGSVLAPVLDNNACLRQSNSNIKKDWNKVKISAILSNKSLVCTPSEITLFEEKGFARCYLDEGGYTGLNYYAPLQIELNYVYQTSISQIVSIERIGTPGVETPTSVCQPWQQEINGVCLDYCEACSEGRFDCGVLFSFGDWKCLEQDRIETDSYRTSECIHDPFFCSPERICCLTCDSVDNCIDYDDKESCNSNPCEASSACAWTRLTVGQCAVCRATPGSSDYCELQYSDLETCESDPCNYGCKWYSREGGKCIPEVPLI